MTDALKLPELPDDYYMLLPQRRKVYDADHMQAYVLADRAQRQVSDAERLDAARYRYLRDNMSFATEPMQFATMTLSSPIAAQEHDAQKDWMSPRFEASVDRTVDAAIRSQQSQAGKEGGAL